MEVLEFIVANGGPYALAAALGWFVIKYQKDSNDKLLNFMLEQIEKQGTLMQELKDTITDTKNYMMVIKEELNLIKGDKEL